MDLAAAPSGAATEPLPVLTNNAMEDTPHNTAGLFGEVIYAYSRSQAVADGLQVEATKIAAEAGIRFPVFLTRAVFDNYVAVRRHQEIEADHRRALKAIKGQGYFIF
jgi:hypothetical protein